jgi:hypothetical protein
MPNFFRGRNTSEVILTEARIVTYDGVPITEWIPEYTVLVHFGKDKRLSGSNIRTVLYFATDVNTFLRVSKTKTDLAQIIEKVSP